jgi:periplasmic divalent cation tolerance protein
MNEEVSSVYVTYPDEPTARSIARSLVERRLAACANIFDVCSIYRWNEEVQEELEFASLLKIRSKDFQAVAEAIREMHPYDVPCIVRYDIAESVEDYRGWIVESTARSLDHPQ